ncbi:MAG: DUF255 domain-containing protein [Desulfobacteraceae bacterium]|nr:DUF255 domain-containing protein [Desulfobacteraceae bacterium]MBC2757029.1 DUF255 domain-containing protein [Desulfobacteraceae bacterium]
MNIKKITLFYFVVFFSLMISSAASVAEKKEIQWQSYETGIKMIQDQNKKGFLHFYTDWCTYCKIMNNQTFSDSKIIEYLNNNFVAIRVNAEKQKNVAKKYGVNRFPNTWFIAEDSSSLSSQPGFIPPEMLLDMLKFLNTDSFKNMKFSEFIKKQEKTQAQKKAVTQ